MKKSIVILGSSGSVGRQAINVVRNLGDTVKITGLAVKNNIDILEKQIREFEVKIACVFDEVAAEKLRPRVPWCNIVYGMRGLCDVATYCDSDFVIMGMVGSHGILPTAKAIEAKKNIGLANKEILVSAGEYIFKLAKDYGVNIIPIDSEHSAILQCLSGENIKNVSRLILTASGGPFLKYKDEEFKNIRLQDALKHPTWTMGEKVSIDCSTLMNKGFEVIEARWIFDILSDRIDVVVHPQSFVHSFVEFIDGSMKAQIAYPNMELPIQYAITYPDRVPRKFEPFNFKNNSKFEFYEPDRKKFRCLDLAYIALQEGGTMPCFLNAANEVLVDRFCRGDISWLSISEKLEILIKRHRTVSDLSVELLLEVDCEARIEASVI